MSMKKKGNKVNLKRLKTEIDTKFSGILNFMTSRQQIYDKADQEVQTQVYQSIVKIQSESLLRTHKNKDKKIEKQTLKNQMPTIPKGRKIQKTKNNVNVKQKQIIKPKKLLYSKLNEPVDEKVQRICQVSRVTLKSSRDSENMHQSKEMVEHSIKTPRKESKEGSVERKETKKRTNVNIARKTYKNILKQIEQKVQYERQELPLPNHVRNRLIKRIVEIAEKQETVYA